MPLSPQLILAVCDYLATDAWRSLAEIEAATGAPEDTLHLAFCARTFGGHPLRYRRRQGTGVYEYRLLVNAASEAA